jgi:hypothetical protein
MLIQMTEYLAIDLATERWICHRCGHDLCSAHECYKKGCLVRARDPREIHFPLGPSKEFNFSFDPEWISLIDSTVRAPLVETSICRPAIR